jgi:hypothetical protein
MTSKWFGPPLPGEKRQPRDFVKAGGQDNPQNIPPEPYLQITRRREAGPEPFSAILDYLAAEHGWPLCTATAEAVP